MNKTRLRPVLAFGLAALSGLLVFGAFPPLDQSELGFIALIPFVFGLRIYPAAMLRLSYFAGLVFWIPSLWFLSPVTIPGAMVLAAYCALYWVPVGWGWGKFLKSWQPARPFLSLRFVVGGAAWWCLMEFLRGVLLTGFPWNQLGVSQWQNFSLVQLASLGGVLLLSFLLVTLNLGIAISTLSLFESMGKGHARRMHPELYLPVLMLVMSFTWGSREFRRCRAVESDLLRVAVIQPLAENKWSEELAREHFRVLWELSDLALGLKPDLLLWPETSVPESYRYSLTAKRMVARLMQYEVPLLLGSLDSEIVEGSDPVEMLYYNTAFMISPEKGHRGEFDSEYRKKHLVMFGEYIPFGNLLSFLRSLTPMPDDVTPGDLSGVLPLPGTDWKVGMLICFEDLMPGLSTELAREGADVFVNQTNDAWFDPLWGSEAHLGHAVFRSVEQRRPMVRGTNSGVSASIEINGYVSQTIEDPQSGNFRIRGFDIFEVAVPKAQETPFYSRFPWMSPVLAAGLSLLLIRRKIS